jgi:uncharacterized protein (TIGR04255 family)
MAFPDAPRVLYEINPLDEVVCQLKFPPVLRIDAEMPVGFQEAIRSQFPLYRAEPSANVRLPPGPASSGYTNYGATSFGTASQRYIFETIDKAWQVTLARDVMGLTCRKKYDRWENFRSRLESLLEPLSSNYRPSFFSHVCLRYRDVIRPWQLDVPQDAPWGELIQPWIGGPYNRSEVAADVECVLTRTVIRLPSPIGRLDASYGLANEQPGPKQVFLIDAHLFKDGQTELSNVIPSLNLLNRQAGLFFRWCITERLHQALRPGNSR